jgi:hypothetical protein
MVCATLSLKPKYADKQSGSVCSGFLVYEKPYSFEYTEKWLFNAIDLKFTKPYHVTNFVFIDIYGFISR